MLIIHYQKLNRVNTTESTTCGITVTVKPDPSNMTSATDTRLGTEAPP
ncbi:MAG TPA: hypothetical protein VE643_03330 [Nitrososphaeraceae archaeon]|nr:hypothetical protein [Nitrososphaeraceae archaeon]